ncbi:NAD(P)/FAD-dependent oxidoreductase [Streptomyces iranensis]|uniref:Ferredoxin reductase n=1 Tax=Streptomyces iranensis TaxID=576784 RepID=A0A060ZL11_9ACTN|nr:FAD-dependent oxidoreductase [Streptomyces iranensis]MBP2060968.1 3-phenylpropionate/trans-cinnamate dioxygenase ferredoxin reductase subunit [Streptomyces iranensis]CDR06439.1 ferredoxin reductase [Streptomyces iranensis]
MTSRRVVVVGASLAGATVARTLRSNGFTGEVTLAGAEGHRPYDRPPLSKQVLTDETRTEFRPAGPGDLDDLDITWRPGATATGVDLPRRAVTLDSGASIGFDDLVIATGARPLQPFADPPDGVVCLRTLDEAMALRAAMRKSTRLAVIGGGFIGLEVASAARSIGLDVVVVEAARTVLSRGLVPEAGEVLATIARDSGVTVRCGRQVVGFAGAERVEGVVLDGGDIEPCDLVVVGVGAVPNVEWLAGSGIEATRRGVLCDASGRAAHQAEGVWAVGDAACWQGPDLEHRRYENWTSASEQARVVAANIADNGSRTVRSAPYVWSDQFGRRLHVIGETLDHDAVRFVCSEPDDLAVLYAREGALVGACVIDRARLALRCRTWVARATPLHDIPPWQDAA